MHAFDLLREDHSQVDRLFNLIEETTDFDEKQRLFWELKQGLDAHSYIEEAVFYPLFQEDEELQDLIETAFDDHQEVRELLNEMNQTTDQEEFDDQLLELTECVQSHVEEEENELFPIVERKLSDKELRELGLKLDAEKRHFLTSTAA
jgi:hemerythrin-like domain-containing protein